MKEMLPKLSFIALILVITSLPTFRSFTPILIVLFALLTIIHAVVNNAFRISNKKIIFTGLAFFMVHLISVFYSENKDIAWFDIEVKLSLVLFPLLFSIDNKVISRNINTILGIFSSVVVLVNIYLLYIGMSNAQIVDYMHITRDEVWRFSSEYFSKYIHPSYLSMYNLFVISFLIKILINSKSTYRFLLILIISFLLITIFLLQAKAGFLALGIVLLYIIVLVFLNIENRIIKYALPLILLVGIGYSISRNYRMQLMYNSVVEIIKTGDSKTSSTGVRFEIWKVTTSLIKQNILFGVGAGDIKPELNKMYAEDSEYLEEATERHLNVHNQYLETWLGQGIIGFVLLMALFVLALQLALKNKDNLLALFIIIIMVNFFPESMLNNMHGVVFFSVFYYFLTLVNEEDLSYLES